MASPCSIVITATVGIETKPPPRIVPLPTQRIRPLSIPPFRCSVHRPCPPACYPEFCSSTVHRLQSLPSSPTPSLPPTVYSQHSIQEGEKLEHVSAGMSLPCSKPPQCPLPGLPGLSLPLAGGTCPLVLGIPLHRSLVPAQSPNSLIISTTSTSKQLQFSSELSSPFGTTAMNLFSTSQH